MQQIHDTFRDAIRQLKRPQVVWLSLVASMTAVGGLLLALQGERAPRLDGLALASPVTAAGPASMDLVFRTRAEVDGRRWDGIVLHHSGSLLGSAEQLAAAHQARGLHGLGYHFVVGNGRGSEDGEIHVGYRWMDQLPGAHVAGVDADRYNRRYIGVCLVGDGDRRGFTEAQLRRTAALVRALMDRLGLSADDVRLHRDLAATSSPGRHFPEAELRRLLSSGG